MEQRRRPGQLLDGQTSLWESVDAYLVDDAEGELWDILDIVHVAGYVWRAAKVFHSQREPQEAFVREPLLRILQGDVWSVIRGRS